MTVKNFNTIPLKEALESCLYPALFLEQIVNEHNIRLFVNFLFVPPLYLVEAIDFCDQEIAERDEALNKNSASLSKDDGKLADGIYALNPENFTLAFTLDAKIALYDGKPIKQRPKLNIHSLGTPDWSELIFYRKPNEEEAKHLVHLETTVVNCTIDIDLFDPCLCVNEDDLLHYLSTEGKINPSDRKHRDKLTSLSNTLYPSKTQLKVIDEPSLQRVAGSKPKHYRGDANLVKIIGASVLMFLQETPDWEQYLCATSPLGLNIKKIALLMREGVPRSTSPYDKVHDAQDKKTFHGLSMSNLQDIIPAGLKMLNICGHKIKAYHEEKQLKVVKTG